MTPTIRRLMPEDAPDYVRLRSEALVREPFSFGASPGDDRASSLDFVREALADPHQAIIGAFAPELVGTAGIYREHDLKTRHKTRIWGVYVSAAARGGGLGRKLMEGAIGWARALDGVRQVHLVVSPRTPTARVMYQSLGFVRWGVEPNALYVNGEMVDDEHMVLML